jgi:hypothetical protein
VLAPWAKLQAMLQGILQGAGPVGCYYKVLTGRVVKREFKACWPSFWGVLFLDVLLLDPRSWILVPGVFVPGVLVPGVRVLGVTIGGPGGFRLTRLLRVVAG